ncbi:MAG: AMP-binding protein [Burkholderiaceae bacterium]|nr:AMP-binding protein [Burkholderiaceae bacterium]MEB2317864.1 AMP-binding protein [Pseudomonadota bacterium]
MSLAELRDQSGKAKEAQMNLIDYFDAGVIGHAGATCFQDHASRTSAITYSEADDLINKNARGLQALKLQPGFHGAVLSGNNAGAFIALLSILRADGVWLPVNARNSLESNIEFLRDMECDVLFYQASFQEQINRIKESLPRISHYIVLEDDAREDMTMSALGEGWLGTKLPNDYDPDKLALIMGTGGTTGRSKGVMLTHRNVTMTLANHMSIMAIKERMTVLAAAPITHTAGLVSMPFMCRGGRVILMDGINPQDLLRTIEVERVGFIFLPPTVIYMLLAQPNVRDFDFSSLRYMMYGAAPMSPDKLAEAIEVFGPVMIQIYGQAEVPGAISALTVDEHFIDGKIAPRDRLLSAGRRFPFVRAEIMDENGNILSGARQTGEIVAQGDIVTPGYYKNPEATAEVRKNGWHCTGDIGYFDEDGFLYIVDRKKDMIVTGGFNVFSSEVEAAIMAHPAVKDCAVIGVPDEKWGEAVKAVIELRQGHSVDVSDLIQLVKERLGSVKAPKTIDIVEELPRSAVGKVLKKEVRKKYWGSHERLVS